MLFDYFSYIKQYFIYVNVQDLFHIHVYKCSFIKILSTTRLPKNLNFNSIFSFFFLNFVLLLLSFILTFRFDFELIPFVVIILVINNLEISS